MTIQELFILSEHALTKVVDQIKDEQWTLEVPAAIAREPGTLKKIINYHVYDDIWVPEVLAGKTIAEVGDKYEGDLLGEDPKKSWHTVTDKTITAVKNLTDVDKKVHLSYGDFSAHDYLWHIATFRMFRAVDLARLIGVDDTLPPELVQGMWDTLLPKAEWLRQVGVFTPEVPVAKTAPLQARLLGLSGRQP